MGMLNVLVFRDFFVQSIWKIKMKNLIFAAINVVKSHNTRSHV